MDFANETEADLAADACDVSDKPVRSPVHLPKAVHKKWICEVFDIDPDAVTARHVLDEKRAFARLINGFLLNDKTPLGLCTHGRLEQWGGIGGADCFLNRTRVGHLHRSLHSSKELTPHRCAVDLLTSTTWFGANGNQLEWCLRCVHQSPCAQRY